MTSGRARAGQNPAVAAGEERRGEQEAVHQDIHGRASVQDEFGDEQIANPTFAGDDLHAAQHLRPDLDRHGRRGQVGDIDRAQVGVEGVDHPGQQGRDLADMLGRDFQLAAEAQQLGAGAGGSETMIGSSFTKATSVSEPGPLAAGPFPAASPCSPAALLPPPIRAAGSRIPE